MSWPSLPRMVLPGATCRCGTAKYSVPIFPQQGAQPCAYCSNTGRSDEMRRSYPISTAGVCPRSQLRRACNRSGKMSAADPDTRLFRPHFIEIGLALKSSNPVVPATTNGAPRYALPPRRVTAMCRSVTWFSVVDKPSRAAVSGGSIAYTHHIISRPYSLPSSPHTLPTRKCQPTW